MEMDKKRDELKERRKLSDEVAGKLNNEDEAK